MLLNTAVSGAKDPIKMAQAMKLSIEAGRLDLKQVALHVSVVTASSPLEGMSVVE